MSVSDQQDAKLEREISLDLEERRARWQAERDIYVATRGAELLETWFESMKASFRTQAGEEHDRQAPPWTFSRVADLRLRHFAPDSAHRAKTVARLAALHEANASTRKPEPSTYLTVEPGRIVSIQGGPR